MIDTAGTITNAAKVLQKEGAREVYACATHAVFSPPAVERLSSGVFQEVRAAVRCMRQRVAQHAHTTSPALRHASDRPRASSSALSPAACPQVIVTNTIPVSADRIFPQLTILSVANLLGETIWRVYNAASVQALRD